MSQDLVQFVSDFENRTYMCHGMIQNRNNDNSESKVKLNSYDEGLMEFFNDEMIARSAKCTIKLTEDALMCSECKRMVDINPILQVKLEYPDPEHNLETQYDNNDENEDFNDENPMPEVEVKTEFTEG